MFPEDLYPHLTGFTLDKPDPPDLRVGVPLPLPPRRAPAPRKKK